MQNLRSWSIGLLTSTQNNNYVKIFEDTIVRLGFDFVYYKKPNYNDSGTNPHNNCFLNQTNFDISILLIDERYGTPDECSVNKSISITKAEYINTIGKKINLIFIKSTVFDDYKKYKKGELKKFDKKYDNPLATFKFIGEIESGKLGESVLLHPFVNEKDLPILIENQIKGLNKQIARKYILEKNLEQVENYKRPGQIFNLKTIVGSETDKIQTGGYYVEPNAADPKKKPIDSISEFIKDKMKGDEKGNVRNIMVHGNAGAGKSTSLMKAYLTHNKEYREAFDNYKPLSRMPVFFSLSNIKIEKGFNPFNIILEASNKKPFPIDDFWNIEDFVFYFDSFDESMSCKNLGKTRDALKILNYYKHVLTTRTSNYHYIQRNFPNFNAYDSVAEIEGWKHDKIIEYINAKYKNDSETNVENIKKMFDSIKEAFPPLIVTLCLYNVDQSRRDDGSFDLENIIKKDPNGRYMRGHILKEAVENNLRCESLKETHDENEIKKLVSRKREILNEAGWIISSYRNKHEAVSPEQLIKLLCNDVFKNRFKNLNASEKENLIINTLKLYFDLNNSFAVRAVHSLFIDLFGACCYLQKVKNKKLSHEDAKILLSSEGNRMVGDFALLIPTEEKRIYLDYLTSNYKKAATLSERVIYCYTIPRFLNDQNKNDKPLKAPLIKFCLGAYIKCLFTNRISEQVMLLNWMVQSGNMFFEKIYYRKLSNKRFAEANRIAYMIYMDQSGPKIELNDKDRKQNPKREWIDTLAGVLEHYNTNDKRHRFIRRIDIKILRTYIEVGYSTYADIKFINYNKETYTLYEFFKMLRKDDLIWDLNIKGEIGKKYQDKLKKHALLKKSIIERTKKKLLKEVDLMLFDLEKLK